MVFDYMFYRIAKFYYKKDGVDAICTLFIVSVIQGLLFGAIVFSVLRALYGLLETAKYTQLAGKIGIVVGILLLVFNFLRYKGKYWRFAERWKDTKTEKQRRIRGILVVVAILFPFLLLFWMGTSAYR